MLFFSYSAGFIETAKESNYQSWRNMTSAYKTCSHTKHKKKTSLLTSAIKLPSILKYA